MGEDVPGPLLLSLGVLREVDALGDQAPAQAHQHAAVHAAAAADLDRGAVDDLDIVWRRAGGAAPREPRPSSPSAAPEGPAGSRASASAARPATAGRPHADGTAGPEASDDTAAALVCSTCRSAACRSPSRIRRRSSSGMRSCSGWTARTPASRRRGARAARGASIRPPPSAQRLRGRSWSFASLPMKGGTCSSLGSVQPPASTTAAD